MPSTTTALAITAVIAACGDGGGGGGTHDGTEQTAAGTRTVTRTDIVSDQAGAMAIDETLVNAWGLAFNPDGVAWVAAEETGWAQVYDAAGERVIPPVAIPDPDDPDEPDERSEPTGQVFNADSEAFEGDVFILVTEDGTVAGWQPDLGEQAVTRAGDASSDAVYKGAAIVEDGDGNLRLLAADFRGRKIDVFDEGYADVTSEAAFVDPDIPEDFAPFNVETFEDWVLVTYARQDDDGDEDVPGEGNGYVSLFDVDGQFVTRLLSQGELNSPWGATLTPDAFDAAPGRLLIGNFGDGRIFVYRVELADGTPRVELEGALVDEAGEDLIIDGLWALEFGPDAGGFSSDQLYFTAGPTDEEHGVFGRLSSVEPGDGGDGTGGDGDDGFNY